MCRCSIFGVNSMVFNNCTNNAGWKLKLTQMQLQGVAEYYCINISCLHNKS